MPGMGLALGGPSRHRGPVPVQQVALPPFVTLGGSIFGKVVPKDARVLCANEEAARGRRAYPRPQASRDSGEGNGGGTSQSDGTRFYRRQPPQTGGLTTVIFSAFWRPEVENPFHRVESRCRRAVLPSEAPGEGPACLVQRLGAPGAPGLWLHHSVSASIVTWPPLLCRVTPPVSLAGTMRWHLGLTE